jgi:hypothetical protein
MVRAANLHSNSKLGDTQVSNIPSLKRGFALTALEDEMASLCARGQIDYGLRHTDAYKAQMKSLRDSYLILKRSPDLPEEVTR